MGTGWEVWIMDNEYRRQQLWTSGMGTIEVNDETLVWKGNALVTKETIRVVQAIEQIELNIREKMKNYFKQQPRTRDT
jgi:hypothetical protein